MEGGEVCKSLTEDDFLLCIDHIGKRLFLILNDSNANSYDENCDLAVRKLYPNENITINFS